MKGAQQSLQYLSGSFNFKLVLEDDEDSSAFEGSKGFSADGFCKAGDMEIEDKSADSTAKERLKQFHGAKQVTAELQRWKGEQSAGC